MDDQKIKEILVSQDYVSLEDMQKAEEYAQVQKSSIVEYLFSNELINRTILGQAIAEFLKVPYYDLGAKRPDKDTVVKIPAEVARKYRVVLFEETQEGILASSDEPQHPDLAGSLQTLFPGKSITIGFSLAKDIDDLLVYYRQSLETRFDVILKQDKRIAPELIDEIMRDAITYKASDLHFEPLPNEVLIRFRIDGILQEAGRIPKEVYENILNRIKVQARLRIDDHFSAQDGSIRYQGPDVRADLRVSITPTLEGEKIVIRVLSHYIQGFGLSDIGLSLRDQAILQKAYNKPFGMILVTGPTGSGKSTTLYSILKMLHDPEVNITTIEDPVEYRIVGINQIQVNTLTNLSFASGLRSIVRQDPDIILVGEIRDYETAEIAVNAALTGHLLLSTFHANDAPTAIPRLLDMGIEPFLLASTLEVVIAQRLVRKLCPSCRYSESLSKQELVSRYPNCLPYFPEEEYTLYKSKGCTTCNGSGYKGRIAIFEFIEITPELQDLIVANPSTKAIWELARKQGARSLFEDGIEKVLNGVTTLDELLRVAEPPAPKTPSLQLNHHSNNHRQLRVNRHQQNRNIKKKQIQKQKQRANRENSKTK
jgi:type II secretory ATPase GspE/PulE/Tfp pilus assembly ATPase PilB-like protein